MSRHGPARTCRARARYVCSTAGRIDWAQGKGRKGGDRENPKGVPPFCPVGIEGKEPVCPRSIPPFPPKLEISMDDRTELRKEGKGIDGVGNPDEILDTTRTSRRFSSKKARHISVPLRRFPKRILIGRQGLLPSMPASPPSIRPRSGTSPVEEDGGSPSPSLPSRASRRHRSLSRCASGTHRQRAFAAENTMPERVRCVHGSPWRKRKACKGSWDRKAVDRRKMEEENERMEGSRRLSWDEAETCGAELTDGCRDGVALQCAGCTAKG